MQLSFYFYYIPTYYTSLLFIQYTKCNQAFISTTYLHTIPHCYLFNILNAIKLLFLLHTYILYFIVIYSIYHSHKKER